MAADDDAPNMDDFRKLTIQSSPFPSSKKQRSRVVTIVDNDDEEEEEDLAPFTAMESLDVSGAASDASAAGHTPPLAAWGGRRGVRDLTLA